MMRVTPSIRTAWQSLLHKLDASPEVLVTVPSRVLLEQFAKEIPGFCKVGTGYNDKIDMDAQRYIAVTDSARLLKKLKFEAIFVDEAHHPLPVGLPKGQDLFQFSATHKEDVDHRYGLAEAVEHGVLCDYDLTIPVATEGHPYICFANLLLSHAGRFRRVLAYCNSIAEAKSFQKVLATVGLAAWHMMDGLFAKRGRGSFASFQESCVSQCTCWLRSRCCEKA